jgi:hypothetical protein
MRIEDMRIAGKIVLITSYLPFLFAEEKLRRS